MAKMPVLIEPRRCVICEVEFTPKTPTQEACQLNPCGRKLNGRRHKARLTARLVAAKRKQARERTERELMGKFGTLSERELLLFNIALRVGYMRGYNKGYHGASRRRVTA